MEGFSYDIILNTHFSQKVYSAAEVPVPRGLLPAERCTPYSLCRIFKLLEVCRTAEDNNAKQVCVCCFHIRIKCLTFNSPIQNVLAAQNDRSVNSRNMLQTISVTEQPSATLWFLPGETVWKYAPLSPYLNNIASPPFPSPYHLGGCPAFHSTFDCGCSEQLLTHLISDVVRQHSHKSSLIRHNQNFLNLHALNSVCHFQFTVS